MPDGTTLIGKGWRITAEMAEKVMVNFDKWLEVMADTYESQETQFETAQQRVNMLEEESPTVVPMFALPSPPTASCSRISMRMARWLPPTLAHYMVRRQCIRLLNSNCRPFCSRPMP